MNQAFAMGKADRGNPGVRARLASREVDERFVAWLLGLLRDYGGDPDEALRAAGESVSTDVFLASELRSASPERLSRISAVAAVVAGNIDAERVGREPFRGGDWRLLFYCLISCRSLREAIERASQFMSAVNGRCGVVTLHTTGEIAELRWGAASDRASQLSLACALFGVINLHGLLGWLIWRRIPVVEVLVEHDGALLETIHRDLLPFSVRSADRLALLFPASYLDFPVVSTRDDLTLNPTMSFMVEVVRDPKWEGLVERARKIMFEALKENGHLPALPQLAESLEAKPELFRRRLREAGASYNQLKQSCRRELSLDLLHRTTLSVEAISDRLGFCDSDAFRRAFHDWMGASPSAYRKDCRSD
jgi:AraC-like DNA-binding protein